jgi:hypothetical protein
MFFSCIIIHTFACDPNLLKTMGFKVYRHGEVGAWRNLNTLMMVGGHFWGLFVVLLNVFQLCFPMLLISILYAYDVPYVHHYSF